MAFEPKYINGVLYRDVSPQLTSLTTPSPYKLILGSQMNGDSWKFFDKNLMSGSRNSIDVTASKCWFTLDFGKKTRIDGYGLYWESTNYTATSWNIQGSDDNETWEVLNAVPTTYTKSSQKWNDWIFDKPVNYRYYKLQVLTTGGNSTTFYEMAYYQAAPQSVKMVKITEEILPAYVEEPTIMFTDIGNIYISRKDGTLLKMNGAEVKPFEDQNNLLRQEIEQISDILDVINGKVIEVDNSGG